MKGEELEILIDGVQWQATNYLSPHEYVLSREYLELFKALEAYLRNHGYKGLFRNQEYTYVDIGTYRYWIVGSVLNRARLETPGVTQVKF